MNRTVTININEKLPHETLTDPEFRKAIGYASMWGNAPIARIFVNAVGEIDASYYREENEAPHFVMMGLRHHSDPHWSFHS
jgi:hypothetical protein